MTRRRLLGGAAGLAVAAPAARLGWLRFQDNPLPRLSDPEPVIVDGWVLDAGDLPGPRG